MYLCLKCVSVCVVCVWYPLYLLQINHLQTSNRKTSLAHYFPFTLISTRHLSKWHLSTFHLSWWFLSLSAIPQLLLTQFWPNLIVSFLGPTLQDVDYHGNIWPGIICPYQQYLSCYCTNFDKLLKFMGPSLSDAICQGDIWNQYHSIWTKIFFYSIIFGPKFWWTLKTLLDP